MAARPSLVLIHMLTPVAVAAALACAALTGCTKEIIELGTETSVACGALVGDAVDGDDPLVLGGSAAGRAVLDVGSAEPYYFEVFVAALRADEVAPTVGLVDDDGAALSTHVIADATAEIIYGVAAHPAAGGVAYRREGVWLDGADPDAGVYSDTFEVQRPTPVFPALTTGPGDALSLILEFFRNTAPTGHAGFATLSLCP